jgi:hypothetical protein
MMNGNQANPGGERSARPTTGATLTEDHIVQLWRQLLDRPCLMANDDLYAAGASSVDILTFRAQLQEQLGVQPRLRDLLRSRTAADIAALLARCPSSGPSRGARAVVHRGIELTPRQARRLDDCGGLALSGREHPQFSFDVTGPVDADALRAATGDVLRRHAALRTRFGRRDGTWAASVASADAPPPFATRTSAGSDVDALELAERRTPFPDDAGQLLRVRLLETGPSQSVVVLTAEHIVCDGRSLDLVARDLSAAYARRLAAEGPSGQEPPPPARTFSDYARFERELADGAEGAALRRWWADRPWHRLPAAEPGAVLGPGEASRAEEVPSSRWTGALEAAAAGSVTPFAVLLSAAAHAFAELLHLEACTFLVPMLGRPQGFTDVVGNFANAAPISVGAHADARAAQEAIADAIEHSVLPIYDIYDAMGLVPEMREVESRSAWLSYETPPRLSLTGASTRFRRQRATSARMGTSVWCWPEDDAAVLTQTSMDTLPREARTSLLGRIVAHLAR